MEKFKAKFLHRFGDVESDQYHYATSDSHVENETQQEIFDRCRSLAMKTVPKVENPLLKNFIMTKLKGCYCRHL